jgi:fimbrial chaperone protein
MYKSAKIIIKSIILLAFLPSLTVHASLLISPMRVILNDRDRSAEVILINSSDKVRTYRLEWVEKRALPLGGYQDLNEQESANFPTASQMFRMSPKQVTLAPNQRQIVKLAARRPQGLANGEYRSHLKFTVLPDEKQLPTEQQAGIVLNLMLNYSIPVILRQGPINSNVDIDSAKIEQSIVDGEVRYNIEVLMSRSGLSSAYGSIKAYWLPNGGKEEINLGILNSVNFYSELKQAKFVVAWQKPEIPPSGGRLRIVYEGAKEYQGKTLAEKTITL